jgi:hypothetical protein
MKVNFNSALFLPFAAAAFALAFSIVILSDAATTILLNGLGLPSWYPITHLATGAGLFAGGLIVLAAMKGNSRAMLLLGEVFAGGALAAIVIFERMSLWALPYLE